MQPECCLRQQRALTDTLADTLADFVLAKDVGVDLLTHVVVGGGAREPVKGVESRTEEISEWPRNSAALEREGVGAALERGRPLADTVCTRARVVVVRVSLCRSVSGACSLRGRRRSVAVVSLFSFRYG